MIKQYIKRRQFLKTTGGGAVLITSAASPGVQSLINTAHAEATLKLTTLTVREGQVLLKMARHLYPHDSLEDSYYAVVVEGLDQGASSDENLAKQLQDGVAQLDKAAEGDWLAASDDDQLSILEAMQDTPFFQGIRGAEVVSLYNQKPVWVKFGYEGEAFNKGGYIGRGFNDLDWVAEPPAEASPKLN